jgi:hypothetical protein
MSGITVVQLKGIIDGDRWCPRHGDSLVGVGKKLSGLVIGVVITCNDRRHSAVGHYTDIPYKAL